MGFRSIVCTCILFHCSVDNLKAFVQKLVDGELEPYVKSEPIPEDNSGPVTVSGWNVITWDACLTVVYTAIFRWWLGRTLMRL